MLTDGVLLMQHTESDHGILLINPSLQKIFKINKTDMQDENTSKKSNGDYNGYAAGLAHGSTGGPINNNHQFHSNAVNGHYSQQGSDQSGLEPIMSFLRGAGSGTNEAPKME